MMPPIKRRQAFQGGAKQWRHEDTGLSRSIIFFSFLFVVTGSGKEVHRPYRGPGASLLLP
jgi:hypothetical protein